MKAKTNHETQPEERRAKTPVKRPCYTPEVSLQKISDELMDGFILHEYRMINPDLDLSPDLKEKAIFKYQHDGIFHNRVNSIVVAIMTIVSKHISV